MTRWTVEEIQEAIEEHQQESQSHKGPCVSNHHALYVAAVATETPFEAGRVSTSVNAMCVPASSPMLERVDRFTNDSTTLMSGLQRT